MMIERRKHRSEVLQEAVCLYFESVAQRTQATAIALASADGLLVGGTGQGCNLEWLAALGSTGPVGRSDRQEVVDEVSGGQKLSASGLCVHGAPFYLASVGPQMPDMQETSRTLHRIFTPLFHRTGGASLS